MAGPVYQWSGCRFEPTEYRLLKDGEPIALPSKTLDLLAVLLEHAPALVSKADIMAAVWPDAMVEEGNIAFHVSALRRQLDRQGAPSCIETVRGRGYRFVALLSLDTADLSEARVSEADDLEAAPATTERVETAETSEPRQSATETALSLLPAMPAIPQSSRRWRLAALGVLALTIAVMGEVATARPAALAPVLFQPFTVIDSPDASLAAEFAGQLRLKATLRGIDVAASPAQAAAVVTGTLQVTDAGWTVTVLSHRARDGARLWHWVFDLPHDVNRPAPELGPDDAGPRLQGAAAERIADGLARHLATTPF